MAGSRLHLHLLASSYLHGSPYGTVFLLVVVPGEPALIGQDQVLWICLKPFWERTQLCPTRLRVGKRSPKGVSQRWGKYCWHSLWLVPGCYTLIHIWPPILVYICIPNSRVTMSLSWEVATLTFRPQSTNSHPLHPPKKA